MTVATMFRYFGRLGWEINNVFFTVYISVLYKAQRSNPRPLWITLTQRLISDKKKNQEKYFSAKSHLSRA